MRVRVMVRVRVGVRVRVRAHPPHRDRAAAHEHLVHRVRGHLENACSARAEHMHMPEHMTHAVHTRMQSTCT